MTQQHNTKLNNPTDASSHHNQHTATSYSCNLMVEAGMLHQSQAAPTRLPLAVLSW
jgi:hypothetical protein